MHLTVSLARISNTLSLFSGAAAVGILFSALETHTEIIFRAQMQELFYNSILTLACSHHKRHYTIQFHFQALLVTMLVLQTATESLTHLPTSVKAS